MKRSSAFTVTQQEIIAEQARKDRTLYPELFAARDEHDRRIRHALYHLSDPADPKSQATPQVIGRALESLRQLNAGISTFCEEGC